MMNSTQLRHKLQGLIVQFVEMSSENNLNIIDEKSWKTPTIGFSAGNNPLFEQYKKMIGDFYWTPLEALSIVYPNETFSADNISVVSWILPQTDLTRNDQRLETDLPAKRWIYSRYYGEIFNEHLRQHVVDQLKSLGIQSVAPCIIPEFGYRTSVKEGIASNWSERHTAYTAGLGTFGLSDGFISKAGKAIRIGSVVINAALTPDHHPFEHHMDNCLYITKGTCGICMKRCPVGAITPNGHNKEICHKYIREVTAIYAKEQLGETVTPCGLCQVKVPCEKSAPVKHSK